MCFACEARHGTGGKALFPENFFSHEKRTDSPVWFQVQAIFLHLSCLLRKFAGFLKDVLQFWMQIFTMFLFDKNIKLYKTVLHYLYKCVHVQYFWNQFIDMLKDLCTHCERLTLSPSLIIFGIEENTRTDECFDFILLHAKFFIYKCRLNNNRPRIEQFKIELKYLYSIDKYVHSIEMSQDKFNRKWMLYNRLIE